MFSCLVFFLLPENIGYLFLTVWGPKLLMVCFHKSTSRICVDIRNARNVRNVLATLEH
jgi:hypothetical protein